MRINKYLSDAGVCSRREADRRIAEGRVKINGRTAQMGDRVEENDAVSVDDVPVSNAGKQAVYLMLNKPKGIVCSTVSTHGETNVVDFVNYPERIYPVGRLDKDSEGLLILTNDGERMNEMLRARNFHEKEYVVTLDRPYDPAFLRKMSEGVPILDTVTRKCRCTAVDEKTFRIVLTQGLNRQIRRMCDTLGYRVVKLCRVRFLTLSLGDLPLGEYRKLTPEEIEELNGKLKSEE